MQTNLLVDAIMRQTTVLIAQLTVTAGIRAPLAHLADEVFMSLSKELEDQGLSRKVVADMFGMALRSYQRRVHRINESATESGQTLWVALFHFIETEGPVTRRDVFERFPRDDPRNVGAVLSDLVNSGLATRTGVKESTVFAATPKASRQLLAQQNREETANSLVLLDICHHAGTDLEDVASRSGLDLELVEESVGRLKAEGRVREDADGRFEADSVTIPMGAEQGWEVALFDHFQAVTSAMVNKLRHGKTRADEEDLVGGGTVAFDLDDEHPLFDEAVRLMPRLRDELNDLWERVEAANQDRTERGERKRLVFYFGQFLKGADS